MGLGTSTQPTVVMNLKLQVRYDPDLVLLSFNFRVQGAFQVILIIWIIA